VARHARHCTHVQLAAELAVALELHVHALVEREADEVERALDRLLPHLGARGRGVGVRARGRGGPAALFLLRTCAAGAVV
jgi:hypothetical protein